MALLEYKIGWLGHHNASDAFYHLCSFVALGELMELDNLVTLHLSTLTMNELLCVAHAYCGTTRTLQMNGWLELWLEFLRDF